MPISLRTRLNRPEYLFNPRAILARARRGRSKPEGHPESLTVSLPWSQQITVFPDELGRTLALTGVFDIAVTETIHRLVEPGDLTVDVGANVGYVTNLMAVRAGSAGRVVAFEPHPDVFALLERNAERWNAQNATAPVEVGQIALSDRPGSGRLQSPGEAGTHMGLASLAGDRDASVGRQFEVELGTLDETFPTERLQLLKIDVEGHEHAVLQGAHTALAERRIRDIVFEEHAIYPASSMTLLEEHGMTLFTLKHSLLGPRVHPVAEGPAPPVWPGPNYLATLDPQRALERLKPRGWQSMGGLARLAWQPVG